jgi:hypothetical protein
MIRGVTMRVLKLVVLAIAAAALWAAPAMGQSVYDHGSDIWVMNDDGSNPHALITVSQVQGMNTIGDPNVFANGGTKVTFAGTTNANQAPVGSGPAGACGINCEGVYTYDHGAITRLSGTPAPCGPGQQWCASFSGHPAWMANGNIAYEYSLYTWEYSCAFIPCTWQFNPGSIDEIDQLPPSGGTPPGTKFPTQEAGLSADSIAPIVDPADASKIAYIGGSNCDSTGCTYPLLISTGSGTDTPVVYDDVLKEAAWSPDGSTFADVEGGDQRGIWTYDTTAAIPSKKFTWALKDPLQTGADPGNSTFDVTFSHVGWIGTSKIIFSANDNLWTIPASCGQNGTPCSFPQDATQLTTDGTDQSRNTASSWTSATSSLAPPSACTGSNCGGNNCTGSNCGGNNGGGGDPISKVGLASGSVKTGKPLTIEVTLTSATKVLVEVLRFVPASGHGKHRRKAHYKPLGVLAAQGNAGLNRFGLVKVKGHKLKPGKYELLISAGGKTYTLRFKVRA